MKRSSTPKTLIYLFLGATVLLAQTPERQVKRVPARAANSFNGADMFRQYCAVCHGTEGRGDGPAASALNKRPADLTQLSRKHNGQFPELVVQRYIRGDEEVVAHGNRTMPVWGPIFNQMNGNEDLGTIRVYALLKYVQQLQAK
jgi:mono/diheme cytochrome c family protein